MKILDIGCGDKKVKISSYKVDGIDKLKTKDVDIVCNIEKEKWPIKDNTYDVIYANHVLEHVDNLPHVLREIIRVGKHGSTVKIKVPHFTNNGAFRDPTHRRFFAYRTFDHFALYKKRGLLYEKLPNYFPDIVFNIKKKRILIHNPTNRKKLSFLKPIFWLIEELINKYLTSMKDILHLFFQPVNCILNLRLSNQRRNEEDN